MHYDDWNGGGGSGGLVLMGLMMAMMLLFWGGVIWVVVTLFLRRSSSPTRDPDNPAPQQGPSAKALLDERLARATSMSRTTAPVWRRSGRVPATDEPRPSVSRFRRSGPWAGLASDLRGRS